MTSSPAAAASSSPSSPAVDPGEPAALRLLRINWATTQRRDAGGAMVLPATFVAEQGRLVRILDVRDADELTGALGHIPQVTHVPLARLGDVPGVLPPDTFVVVVSNTGERASVGARLLLALGMKRVAAMEGGMTAWKSLGYTTLRTPTTFRRELFALAPGMGRDGRPLSTTEAPRGPLSLAQIEQHLGDSTSVRWVKLAAFLLHGKRSCVDGRDDHGVIGTPGGDAGELLLGLAAAERLRGRALEQADVLRLLEHHIDTFGRFYMHSDTHAMNRLIVDGLRKDDRVVPHLGTVFAAEEWRAWLAKPPPAAREAVLFHLTRPTNIGCGHLKFAMTAGDDYGVRPELAEHFLRAFHTLRWAGAPEFEFVILGGDHVEGAVANVVVPGALRSYTRVPLVSPMVAGQQMFVNHPQVTSFLRREQAAHLAEADVVAAADTAALADAIEALGQRQAGQTLGRLARGLPLFELTFAPGSAPVVRQTGVV
jgi:rhodanese-related sulfurtransferase